MNVILISPGFPMEMPLFTRGLAEVGAHVLGIGDQPLEALPEETRVALSSYLRMANLWNEPAVVEAVCRKVGSDHVDHVECLWEPGMVLAARLREALGVPGLTVEQTVAFRDKEVMKQKLDEAGIRTPRHARARTVDEVREAAERIGYPLIVKPIDGAGSADTWQARDQQELDEALRRVHSVPEVSVEEFIEGEEFTFDTICSQGEILFHNVAWYRPKPLTARLNEWMSPQAVCLRDTTVPEVQKGVDLGKAVIKALGFETGFSHMEWFLTPEGEAVFGEIGARSPGGRLVHVMNYAADIDLFHGWAEAVCHGRLSQEWTRPYNAAVVFKRAQGDGIVRRIEGMDSLMNRFGEHIVNVDLVGVGQPRRDWRQVVSGDGWVVVRHPDLDTTLSMADQVGTDLKILASP